MVYNDNSKGGVKMEKEFSVVCPYCCNENYLNIADYEFYLHQPEILKTLCESCGNDFAFEVNITITAESFQY